MQITCPHCRFSKDVNQQWIPRNPSQVDCPKCKGVFYFSHEEGESLTPPAPAPTRLTCPACGLEQPDGKSCVGCGIVFAKFEAKHAEAAPEAGEFSFETEEDGFGEELAPTPAQLPKAGFWIRFAAYLLDGLICSVLFIVLALIVTSVMGVSFMQVMMASSSGTIDDAQMQALAAQMSMALLAILGMAFLLAFFYIIVPTAGSGQTLGKKICGIRVIRKSDDRVKVGIGRALLREVIGKWLSSLIFMIGYLMAAFHGQKQALHDMVAGTYVIKVR